MGLPGCGTNLNEALYQAAGATGRTFLDILLTDLANTLADSFDQGGTPPPEDELDGGDGNGTIPPDDPPFEELIGDPGAGEGLYASNSCTPCHCADAAGGCALNAPSLVGTATDTLDDRLRGDAAHPGGKFNLTNQEIVDLQAYLASLDADNG
jgi:mono/diheme cytochrome c family protein